MSERHPHAAAINRALIIVSSTRQGAPGLRHRRVWMLVTVLVMIGCRHIRLRGFEVRETFAMAKLHVVSLMNARMHDENVEQ